MARVGRGLVWMGLAAQTASIVWRAFRIGAEPLHGFLPGMAKAFASGPARRAAVYVLIFALAALAMGLAVLFRRRRAVWLLAAGGIVLAELILFDFMNFTRLPVDKVYEYLSLASWCAVLAPLALSPALGWSPSTRRLAVATCLLVVFAAVHPKTMELQLVPVLQSVLAVHPRDPDEPGLCGVRHRVRRGGALPGEVV